MAKRWYIVHAYSNLEPKVAESIRRIDTRQRRSRGKRQVNPPPGQRLQSPSPSNAFTIQEGGLLLLTEPVSYNYGVVQRAAWFAFRTQVAPFIELNTDTVPEGDIRELAFKITPLIQSALTMDDPRNNPPMTRSTVGLKSFDFNVDGLAHEGMLPDMLQDVKNQGLNAEALGPLFRSAEDYIQMWERCEQMRLP